MLIRKYVKLSRTGCCPMSESRLQKDIFFGIYYYQSMPILRNTISALGHNGWIT